MKVATWNLAGARPNGRERTAYVREGLAQVGADVWVLTEAHPGMTPGEEYTCVAKSAEGAYRGDGCWVTIWARHGMVIKRHELGEEADRAAGVLLQHRDGPKVWLFGTVLPWRSDKRHATLRGAKAFERAIQVQAEEWRAARRAEPSAEFCVAGDFNQELDQPALAGTKAGAAALKEVLRSHELRCVTGGADDPLRARGFGANIDHFALSSGLHTSGQAHVWPDVTPRPDHAPDHYGVSIDVAVA